MVSFYQREAIAEYLGAPKQRPRAVSLPSCVQQRSVVCWLQTLPFCTVVQVFCTVNPVTTALLVQMQAFQIKQGTCVVAFEGQSFRLNKDPLGHVTAFEKVLRLTDTFEYLDTLCVDRAALRELGRVLGLMQELSKGKCFVEPCKGELPRWARGRTLSLSEVGCAALEQAVWAKYLRRSEVFSPVYALEHAGLSDKKVSDGLGQVSELKRVFATIKQDLEGFTDETVTSYSQNEHCGTDKKGSSNRADYAFYQSVLSVKALLARRARMSCVKFACFLAYTPLNRARTVFDVLARRILQKILLSQPATPPGKPEGPSLRKKGHLKKTSLNFCRVPVKGRAKPLLDLSEFPPLPPAAPTRTPLHSEIERHVRELKAKIAVKRDFVYSVLDQLQCVLNVALPGSHMLLFGSYATGLCTESSDVDLQVSNVLYKTRATVQYACMALAAHFGFYPWIAHVQCIPTASVPVVKLQVHMRPFSGEDATLSVDMTFDDSSSGRVSSHLGFLSLKLTRELLRTHPLAESAMLVLKQLLQGKGLNSAYSGGVSSYSLLLWLVAFIKRLPEAPEDLGELLKGFLEFYGSEFDCKATAIDITCNNCFTENKGAEGVFTVDPVKPSLNTTRAAYCAAQVLALFKDTHSALAKRKGRTPLKDLLLGSFRN